MEVALDASALRTALLAPAGAWARLDVVARTGSTNADLLAAADAPDRTVLLAERQDAGRGRLGRAWESPPGSGVTVSVLLRPRGVPAERYGWLPLLTGLALHEAVGDVAPHVPARLKWPNDLLLGTAQRKAAGILAEAAHGPDGTAVVVGVGLNVGAVPPDLAGTATSLAAEGAADVDREDVLVALLTRLGAREAAWRAAGGDPDATRLRDDYRTACATLGAEVRVELPGGAVVAGTAEDVDVAGRLLVLGHGGERRTVVAGDVVHVRTADR